jgi:hypothetical protein
MYFPKYIHYTKFIIEDVRAGYGTSTDSPKSLVPYTQYC